MIALGVNIDHVATLRQARQGLNPDPISAVRICQNAGANSIVCHLREDRRHIQDKDVFAIRKIARCLNLEMSLNNAIIKIALKVQPHTATLVPERRQEITTEGGLDIIKNFSKIKKTVTLFKNRKIITSLFVAPEIKQIQFAAKTGAETIEIHTGSFALAKGSHHQSRELLRIQKAATYAKTLGLNVSAGHGLDYLNTKKIISIKEITELNIGHAIISEAVFVGLTAAIKKMKRIIKS